METPVFSIIIPTYNRAHLILKTLDSIRDQHFKNYELLIIDDGSSDNTKETVADYISNYQINQMEKGGLLEIMVFKNHVETLLLF